MKVIRSLFLDRDGVINELLPNDYVKIPQQFIFKKGVLEELGILSQVFDNIFIITNQQGVGKGLMSNEDLNEIHKKMQDEIASAGGQITKIYSCTHLIEENCICRKPKPGMLNQVFDEFLDVKSDNSIFIGDSSSDIELAKAFNITSVGMLHEHNMKGLWQPTPDYFINNLIDLRMKVLPLVLP